MNNQAGHLRLHINFIYIFSKLHTMKTFSNVIKRTILFYIALFTTATVSAQNVEKKNTGDTLRVMSYNLRFGELASMKQLAEYIKSENPDIVALQELDWKTSRERTPYQSGVEMINELAYHTGMFSLYGKTIDHAGGYYGIGILSKFPVVSSRIIKLPNPQPATEQRILLVAELEISNDKIITFVSTHLDYTSPERREIQIDAINSAKNTMTPPIILCGDLNATQTSNEICNGFAEWGDANSKDFTCPADKPSSRIDFTFFYPKKSFSLIRSWSNDCRLSDHRPIICDIVIN